MASVLGQREPSAALTGSVLDRHAPLVAAALACLGILLVHADTADTERGVREVMALYRARFAQEAVLRVRLPACISLK